MLELDRECPEAVLVPLEEAGTPIAVEPVGADTEGPECVGDTCRFDVALVVVGAATTTLAGFAELDPGPAPIGGR